MRRLPRRTSTVAFDAEPPILYLFLATSSIL